jgi:hypothetical protein
MDGIALAQLRPVLHPDLYEMPLDLHIDDAVLAKILYQVDSVLLA